MAGALLLSSLLAGCATAPQTAQLGMHPPTGLDPAMLLEQTPFFPQERYQCGPASLAMALNAAGGAVTPEDLVSEVFIPGREGALQPEMVAAARHHGFVPYELAPQLENLLAELQAGHPVVVLQNLGLSWYPRWHYAVAVGYNLARSELTLRSGTERRHVIELSRFEYTWARSGHWALVVLPADRLPATADELNYLKSVAAFESLGQPAIAHTAYATALDRWPDSAGLLMGLGNSAYALGRREEAEQAFRRILITRPGYAPALNNLAQVVAERGAWQEAEALARQAVDADGGRSPVYGETLREIAAKRAAR